MYNTCLKNIQATFDTTKHLTDKNIKRRRLERERMQLLEEQREARVRHEREEEQRKIDEERYGSACKQKTCVDAKHMALY